MAQRQPVNRLCTHCMCNPEQGLLLPRVVRSTVSWPIGKAKQARAQVTFGLEQSGQLETQSQRKCTRYIRNDCQLIFFASRRD